MKLTKKQRKQLKEQSVTLSRKELKKIKQEATLHAVDIVNYIPLLVLRDEFGFGTVRLQRFLDKFQFVVAAYNEGRISISDIKDTLEEETGIRWEESSSE